MKPASRDRAAVWSPFVYAALMLALVGGFGLGGALFLAAALHLPLGLWWAAAAQAHGQVQLFGWAGLTVLGVALHFLPRLRGGEPPRVVPARVALALLAGSIGLRLVCQPLLAATGAGWLQRPVRIGLVCAGLAWVAGAMLALFELARALAGGPPLRQREGFRQVAPYLVVAFGSFLVASALTGGGLVVAGWSGVALFDARLDRAIIFLAAYGFLWPICVAMSARLFPLHLRTAMPRHGLLRASLACALGGLALRFTDSAALDGAGQLLLAASIALAIAGLRIFAPRRALPRAAPRLHTEPVQLAGISSYAWLAVTAVILAANGLATLGLPVPTADGEVHAFGAGFVTILILGVGAALFPGFAARPLRSQHLTMLTLLAANLATLARLAPLWLAGILPPDLASALLALGGLCGIIALLLFTANLAGQPDQRVRPTPSQ